MLSHSLRSCRALKVTHTRFVSPVRWEAAPGLTLMFGYTVGPWEHNETHTHTDTHTHTIPNNGWLALKNCHMTKQTAQQCLPSRLCSHTTCTAAAEDGDSNHRAHSKRRRAWEIVRRLSVTTSQLTMEHPFTLAACISKGKETCPFFRNYKQSTALQQKDDEQLEVFLSEDVSEWILEVIIFQLIKKRKKKLASTPTYIPNRPTY